MRGPLDDEFVKAWQFVRDLLLFIRLRTRNIPSHTHGYAPAAVPGHW